MPAERGQVVDTRRQHEVAGPQRGVEAAATPAQRIASGGDSSVTSVWAAASARSSPGPLTTTRNGAAPLRSRSRAANPAASQGSAVTIVSMAGG